MTKLNRTVIVTLALLVGLFIFPKTASAEKRIEVDLTNQRLYAYEDEAKIYEFPISSGKPWWPTPTGEFRVWIKLVHDDMQGGSRALGTYYNLPQVPYVMYFANSQVPRYRGYAIHGTYWHNNFGVPMSHGCVNLTTFDARTLYYWATPHTGREWVTHATADNPGIKINIYGVTPGVN